MASPDGHRWALAVDALERCEGMGGEEIHMFLLKLIALIDLFKERSGLVANDALLRLAMPHYDASVTREALEELQVWSLLIFRKFNGSYSVFEGSDFDIDEEVGRVLATMPDVDFDKLNEIAGLQPIIAKRHYHETGALRWFDVVIAPLADVQTRMSEFRPSSGAVGTFLLAVRTQGESENVASHIAQCASSRRYGLGPCGRSATGYVELLLAGPRAFGCRTGEGRVTTVAREIESPVGKSRPASQPCAATWQVNLTAPWILHTGIQ